VTAAIEVTFETMRCRKCGMTWKLPLSRAEVDQIIQDHKRHCDGEPEEKHPMGKPTQIRSKCINCGEMRACIKIEARAPLAHGPVLVWSDATKTHERVDYETHGPMVEICRGCLRDNPVAGSTLAKFLLEGL
jgi:ribosomal protein S14